MFPASARPAWPRRSRHRSTAAGSASSSHPTCCRPTWSASACTSVRPRRSGSKRGRCSPTSCSPTRSTGRRRRRSRHCSRRWRNDRSPRDGVSRQLDAPFMVIATQNPIDQEGTYRLPESQLDRFLFRIAIGYPGRAAEIEMLDNLGSAAALRRLVPVVSIDEIRGMIEAVNAIYVANALKAYLVDLAEASRRHPGIELGLSPRATLQLACGGPSPCRRPWPKLRDARRRQGRRSGHAQPPHHDARRPQRTPLPRRRDQRGVRGRARADRPVTCRPAMLNRAGFRGRRRRDHLDRRRPGLRHPRTLHHRRRVPRRRRGRRSPSCGCAGRACGRDDGSIRPCWSPATSGGSICASSISGRCGRASSSCPRRSGARDRRRTSPGSRYRPMASGGFTSTGYQLVASGRGIVRLGPLVVENRDPLGMARARTSLLDVDEVFVAPRSYLLDMPQLGQGVLGAHLLAMARRLGPGDFHGLREYVDGDEPRSIHWKASARSEQLLVKEHTTEGLRRCTVVLDTHGEHVPRRGRVRAGGHRRRQPRAQCRPGRSVDAVRDRRRDRPARPRGRRQHAASARRHRTVRARSFGPIDHDPGEGLGLLIVVSATRVGTGRPSGPCGARPDADRGVGRDRGGSVDRHSTFRPEPSASSSADGRS